MAGLSHVMSDARIPVSMDDIRLAMDLSELVFPGSDLPGVYTKVKSGGSMGTGMPMYFAAKGGNDLWIVVRGAAEPADFVLCCEFERTPFLDGCFVHQGVLRAARWIIGQCRRLIDDTLGAGGRVLCTGHSLGGTTAAMIVTVLALEEKKQRVFGISAAMFPAVDEEVSRRLRPYVVGFVFRNDLVPRLTARNLSLIVDMLGGPQALASIQAIVGPALNMIAMQSAISGFGPPTDMTAQVPQIISTLVGMRNETREFSLPGNVFYLNMSPDGLGTCRRFQPQDMQINLAAWMLALGDHNGQHYMDAIMTLESL